MPIKRVWIEPGCLDHRAEIITMMTAAAMSPALAIVAQKQRRIWRAPLSRVIIASRSRSTDCGALFMSSGERKKSPIAMMLPLEMGTPFTITLSSLPNCACSPAS